MYMYGEMGTIRSSNNNLMFNYEIHLNILSVFLYPFPETMKDNLN